MRRRLMSLFFVLVFIGTCFLSATEAQAESSVQSLPSDEIYEHYVWGSEDGNYIYYLTGFDAYSWDLVYEVKKYDVSTGKVSTVHTIESEDRFDCYYINNKLYYVFGEYSIPENKYIWTVSVLDLKTGKNTKLFNPPIEKGQPEAIAADSAGRIYLSVYIYNYSYNEDEYIDNSIYKLMVLDKKGKVISQTSDDQKAAAFSFFGIDEVNHNIYYQGTYNWRYWGYDHYMSTLSVARWNENGKIETQAADRCITIQYQRNFYTHHGSAELLGGKYLADLSTFSGDVFYLLDSSQIAPSDVTESSTSISMLDSGVSVSGVNLGNEKAVILAAQSRESTYENHEDVSSVGSRAAYTKVSNKNILFLASDETTVSCYDIDRKDLIGRINAKYSIYKVMIVNGKLALIEKNNNKFYVESFDIKLPSKVTLAGENNLTVGQAAIYTSQFDSDFSYDVTYSSSNRAVVSVDEKGNASAWKPGSAVITVKSKTGGLEDSFTVTVKDRSITKKWGVSTELKGVVTRNENWNNYSSRANKVNSYLSELSSSTLMRAEIQSNGSLLAENYNTSGVLTATYTVPSELEGAVGFFNGESNRFVVFKQDNYDESDQVEVLRVVKYDSNWNRIASCTIAGMNTRSPVSSGSLRMAEANGVLYIHTCHTMYKSSDGYNHQANMTFEIQESDMTIKDSYSGVMNLSEGYVSHSFNQFIRIHDGYVYRVDHGDAYPRGIAISRYPVDGSMDHPTSYGSMVSFEGDSGANYTGVSVGGLELSNTHAIVAYNQDAVMYESPRNIYTAAYDYESGESSTHKITNYKKSDSVECFTPQLVKLNDSQFLLMWAEFRGEDSSVSMIHIDNTGKPVGNATKTAFTVSDCQPIKQSDGTVGWYVANEEKVSLFNIDPYKIDTYFNGWKQESGKWAYYTWGAKSKNKWVKEKDAYYYVGSDGYMKTGWQKVDGKWYFFNKSGAMQTGWVSDAGRWYYMDADGAMTHGWQLVNGKWYYLGWPNDPDSGAMRTGWVHDGSGWYYMNSSGAMQTGWIKDGNTWYYLKGSGEMAANEYVSGYWLNGNGSWTYPHRASWRRSGSRWWYGDTSGWYAANKSYKIDGTVYTFDAAGWML